MVMCRTGVIFIVVGGGADLGIVAAVIVNSGKSGGVYSIFAPSAPLREKLSAADVRAEAQRARRGSENGSRAPEKAGAKVVGRYNLGVIAPVTVISRLALRSTIQNSTDFQLSLARDAVHREPCTSLILRTLER